MNFKVGDKIRIKKYLSQGKFSYKKDDIVIISLGHDDILYIPFSSDSSYGYNISVMNVTTYQDYFELCKQKTHLPEWL